MRKRSGERHIDVKEVFSAADGNGQEAKAKPRGCLMIEWEVGLSYKAWDAGSNCVTALRLMERCPPPTKKET